MKQTVVYEVRLEIDPEIEQEYDAWLADHIAEMLHFDGFLSAEILVPETDDADSGGADPHAESAPGPPPESGGSKKTVVRQVQYHVASHQHLEAYFSEHADRMRQQGVQRFGDAFSASRAVYNLGVRPARICQNCSAALRGQYCEECGQRDKHRIISLWELLRDLVGDVFELDSRVWRSMRPLLFRPGRLTIEYLRGRRVHYTPPLRLYLITSLVFFLVVFFNAGPDDLTFNGDSDDLAEAIAALEDASDDSDEVAVAVAALQSATGDPEKIAKALADLKSRSGDSDSILNAITALESAAAANSADAQVPETEPSSGLEADPETAADTDDSSGSESLRDNCDRLNIQGGAWADALEVRAKQACENLVAEGGAKRFVGDLIDNAPGMMFFFLPVIALIMAFLYPLSRRYYVEHLLFFVHFHSFFFLVLTLTVLFSRIPKVLPGQESAINLLSFAVTLYIPIYLFVAMRRVYGQSRGLTAVKYGVLGVAYFVSLLFSFTAMALFTALSV